MTLDQISPTEWTLLGVAIVFIGSLIGFFRTKGSGFGPYNTSTLVLVLVLFVATVGFLTAKITSDDMVKLLFAMVGFAAGLFTGRGSNSRPKTRKRNSGDE